MQIELKRIDKEKVLFGEIVLNWTCSKEKINSFNIYRSKNAKIDPATETPYKIIEKAVKNDKKEYTFTDKEFPKENNVYYIIASKADGVWFTSNTELVRLKILESLNIDQDYIMTAAYYESLHKTPYDKKFWRIAEIDLILKNNFNDNLAFLKSELKSIKRSFPEFSGKIRYPLHDEIKEKAKALFLSGITPNNLDWCFMEREAILKKILALVDYEFE